jgi:hypothetical protein
MFRQQFTDFVQDLDEMTLCELIIGHSARSVTPPT